MLTEAELVTLAQRDAAQQPWPRPEPYSPEEWEYPPSDLEFPLTSWESWCRLQGMSESERECQQASRDFLAHQIRTYETKAAELTAADDAELDGMLVNVPVASVLLWVLPGRVASRARAGAVVAMLRAEGRMVRIEHGALKIDPAPADSTAGLVDRLYVEISNLLDEEKS